MRKPDATSCTCIIFRVWNTSCVFCTISWTNSWPILHSDAVLTSFAGELSCVTRPVGGWGMNGRCCCCCCCGGPGMPGTEVNTPPGSWPGFAMLSSIYLKWYDGLLLKLVYLHNHPYIVFLKLYLNKFVKYVFLYLQTTVPLWESSQHLEFVVYITK